MRIILDRLIRHPLGVLYGVLLFAIACPAAVSMVENGSWEAALVDLIMAGVLIYFMLRTVIRTYKKVPGPAGILIAWGMLVLVNVLSLLTVNELFRGISSAESVPRRDSRF